MPKNRRRYYSHEGSDPPPLWLPKGYIILAIAIEKFAEKLYPADWNHHTEEIASYETEAQNGFRPELYKLQRSQENTRSMIIAEAAMVMLRSMHEGSTSSCLFAEGHDLKAIPKGFWTTSLAHKITIERDITIDFLGIDFVPIRGIIVVNELELDAFIEKEFNIRSNAIDLQRIYANTECNLSPYITLMVKASHQFQLVDGRRADGSRVLKKQIVNWLSENWPPELGKLSPTSIKSMATFIRHPKDGNGGITKNIIDKPPLQIAERKP